MRREIPKSVVIVSEINGPDYTSGFVLVTRANLGTYVVTDGNFVKGRESRLKVCFSDGTQLAASLIAPGFFSILRTEFRPPCEEIKFINGDITLSSAMMFPPASPSSFYCLPSFVSLESLEAYPSTAPLESDQNKNSHRFRSIDKLPGTDAFFLVDSHYSERNSCGSKRFVLAPIYTMCGSVMGLVVSQDDTSTVKKIGMSAKNLVRVMDSLRKVALNEKRGADKGCSDVKRSSENKKRRRGDGSSFK